jgi:predicted dehydrogenase
LQSSRENLLVAVASRSLDRARSYASEWAIPSAYGSYQDLLDAPDLDAVYISLPNSLHAQWTIKAMQAGKAVLCEKPLALSMDEIDRIADSAKETGMPVAEAFMYRHHPQTLQVREMVAGGEIGEPHLIRGSFSFRLENPENIRLDPSLGGGSIWDIGCYPISFARFLAAQEPQEVFGWQQTGSGGVDLVFAGQLRFPNGLLAQFDSSFRLPLRMQMEIVGTEGVINLPNPFKPEFNSEILLRQGGQTRTLTIPGRDLYLGEVEDLAAALRRGREPRISLDESRGNLAAILALLDSARSGEPVSLPVNS